MNNKIHATPLSLLAIDFLEENNSRKRDLLFLQICEHYMKYINNLLKNVKYDDKENFIQIYRIEVYTALIKWTMKSNFETYMFPYIKSVYRKFMNDKKIFKKDIDYKLFCELSEEELEKITMTYDENYDELFNNNGDNT